MVPPQPSTPMGNAQSVPPSLSTSSSGIFLGQSGHVPSHEPFPSLPPPLTQYDNVNLRGNAPNASYINGNNSQRGGMEMGTELDSLAGLGFSPQYSQQPMQHYSAAFLSDQYQPHQPQFQSIRGGLESQLQSLRGSVELEQSMFLRQQQQQLLQMSRQHLFDAAAAQLNELQRQRVLQNARPLSQQRSYMRQQYQPTNSPMRYPVQPVFRVGMCARRVTEYMFRQKNRPQDNNIEYWRKFVSDFFTPRAKKKWCVSMYGKGQQETKVFPQVAWHCDLCNTKSGQGFEASYEILPRLFKMKYDCGTIEELLYVDMPREFHDRSGHVVLNYGKATLHSVYEKMRVVRDGQLRIVFAPDLKICAWEFCAASHEEFVPRRLLISQLNQLGKAAEECQASAEKASSDSSVSDLKRKRAKLETVAGGINKAVDGPLLNAYGYPKRYIQCIQLAEVANNMKDLIDFNNIIQTGPIESLAIYPTETYASSIQQQPTFQTMAHASNYELGSSSAQAASMMNGGGASMGNDEMAQDRGTGQHQQQVPGNLNLPGLGDVNGYKTLQSDWNPSS